MWRTQSLVLALGLASVFVGGARAGEVDPFRGADAIYENGLSRLAQEAGDAALLGALSGEGTRERRLLAIRAAPFAAAPERLVPGLIPLALGRDPNLAPEAAAALVALAEGLRPSVLAAREVLLSDLKEATDAIGQLKEGRAVRADVATNLEAFASSWAVLVASAQGEKRAD